MALGQQMGALAQLPQQVAALAHLVDWKFYGQEVMRRNIQVVAQQHQAPTSSCAQME